MQNLSGFQNLAGLKQEIIFESIPSFLQFIIHKKDSIMAIDWTMFTWIFFPLLVSVGIALLLLWGIQSVSQGKQYTIERLGKYNRTLQPGLRLVIPFVERVSNQIDMRERVMDVPRQEVITKDNAMITVDGVVFYKIFDAENATYQVSKLDQAIEQLTVTNIRTVMGSMDLDDLLSKRDDINDKLFKVVDLATDPWGVKIVRVEIKDISPPENLKNAMARQMKAEREKRAAILEAEGEKRALVLKAEGFKEAEILRAEARKAADLLDAEVRKEVANNQALARERLAKAEAKATQMVSQAIKEGDIQAINYFIAEKYVEALKSLASADNQKVIMMPLEAANLISSIGGISDIAKEILTNKEIHHSQKIATTTKDNMEQEKLEVQEEEFANKISRITPQLVIEEIDNQTNQENTGG